MAERPTLCIATGTRADWGLLSPIAAELRARGEVNVKILATNMHLLERYGHTVDEIEADGFAVDARVEMPDGGDSPLDRARAMAACLDGTAVALEAMRPDGLLLLGDRYEMLAVASAAVMLGIPVIHIAGGEITLGAIDDSLRHAITKLASLHLTAADDYSRRVIQMGEDPARVVTIGAPGVWNAMHRPLPSDRELLDSLHIEGDPRIALVTYHPATLDPADPTERFGALLEALDRFPTLHYIITYPNNDSHSYGIIAMLEKYAAERPGRVTAVRSLGAARYLAASRLAEVVIGNSSSGVVEVPSAGTPTVDIGIRQKGRLAGPSVIHCGDSADEIAEAIALALTPAMQELAARKENPYSRPDTVALAADTITAFMRGDKSIVKTFHDLPC